MKKIILIIYCLLVSLMYADTKIGYIDSQIIMSEYEDVRQIQVELEKEQKRLQVIYEKKLTSLDSLTNAYQTGSIILSEQKKKQMESDITIKQQEIQEWQLKYFGPEGMLFSKRQELIKPIQDKIYDAIQQIATNNKYSVIFDSSSDLIMLYSNNNLDKSDKVLELMGY